MIKCDMGGRGLKNGPFWSDILFARPLRNCGGTDAKILRNWRSNRTIRVHEIYDFCINPFLQCQKSYSEVSVSILFNILGPSALICYEIGDRQS